MSSQQMQKVGDLVHNLLIQNPRYRDSDRQLCCKIWALELSIHADSQISAYQFFCEYALGNKNSRLTSAGSITRMRRRLQEEYPELRGKNYRGKQAEAKVVQSFLGYPD